MNWQAAVEVTVTGLGYDLVDAERDARGLLRVYIDKLANDPTGEFITVEDCEKVTRQLQHVLEVEGCAYERLEVSSPGLDRPLKKATDYTRFVGQEVEVTLKALFQGRKKFRGVLLAGNTSGQDAAADQGWRLILKDGPAEQSLDFSLEEVREARLVPVVDFKGRRFAPSTPAGEVSLAEDKEDGGRTE